MTAPRTETAELQRREQQQRYIDLAISGKRRWLAPAGLPTKRSPATRSVPEPQAILTAFKRGARFEAPISVSALREAVYQMERYGWTVSVGEEHAAPEKGGLR